jgi:hypothetical protein
MDDADKIWNRAVYGGAAEAGPGDRALSDLLRLHNLAMSGGVLDAVERLTDTDLAAALAGYHWMGLDVAADIVAGVRDEVAAGVLDHEDRAEALEVSADTGYSSAVPTDGTLEAAFRTRLEQQPEAFSSL